MDAPASNKGTFTIYHTQLVFSFLTLCSRFSVTLNAFASKIRCYTHDINANFWQILRFFQSPAITSSASARFLKTNTSRKGYQQTVTFTSIDNPTTTPHTHNAQKRQTMPARSSTTEMEHKTNAAGSAGFVKYAMLPTAVLQWR